MRGLCFFFHIASALQGDDQIAVEFHRPTKLRLRQALLWAVGGGANAALLAAQILAVSDAEIAAKLDAKRISDAKVVLEKDASVMEKL